MSKINEPRANQIDCHENPADLHGSQANLAMTAWSAKIRHCECDLSHEAIQTNCHCKSLRSKGEAIYKI